MIQTAVAFCSKSDGNIPAWRKIVESKQFSQILVKSIDNVIMKQAVDQFRYKSNSIQGFGTTTIASQWHDPFGFTADKTRIYALLN